MGELAQSGLRCSQFLKGFYSECVLVQQIHYFEKDILKMWMIFWGIREGCHVSF